MCFLLFGLSRESRLDKEAGLYSLCCSGRLCSALILEVLLLMHANVSGFLPFTTVNAGV
jgi:hypothetical protein